jgi:hypothetical protein
MDTSSNVVAASPGAKAAGLTPITRLKPAGNWAIIAWDAAIDDAVATIVDRSATMIEPASG